MIIQRMETKLPLNPLKLLSALGTMTQQVRKPSKQKFHTKLKFAVQKTVYVYRATQTLPFQAYNDSKWINIFTNQNLISHKYERYSRPAAYEKSKLSHHAERADNFQKSYSIPVKSLVTIWVTVNSLLSLIKMRLEDELFFRTCTCCKQT